MTWEGYSVAWAPQADRDLARMQPQIADRVERAIEQHARFGNGDVAPLHARPGYHRPRLGSWRATFHYEPESRRLVVDRVLPRGRAYNR